VRKPRAPRPELPASPEQAQPYDTSPDAAGPDLRDAERRPASGTRHGRETGRGQADALILFGRSHRELTDPEGARSQRAGRDRVVSTGLEDRRRERRRALRRLRLRRLGAVLLAAGAVAALVWVIGFSPVLALRGEDVRVTGSDGTVDVAQVREALAAYEGTSLVRLDVSEMGRDVAEALVRVRAAQVTRRWPNGVEVALTMRVPVAARETEAGYEVLDGEAVVLEVVASAPQGLAMITHEGEESLRQDQVTAVALVVGSLDADTRAQVLSASASATGQVTLVLASGATVRWGDTSQSALKAEVLRSLLTRTASTYDVSSPHSPTTS